MKSIVEGCREANLSLGSFLRKVTNEEINQRVNMRRSLISNKSIPLKILSHPLDKLVIFLSLLPKFLKSTFSLISLSKVSFLSKKNLSEMGAFTTNAFSSCMI